MERPALVETGGLALQIECPKGPEFLKKAYYLWLASIKEEYLNSFQIQNKEADA